MARARLSAGISGWVTLTERGAEQSRPGMEQSRPGQVCTRQACPPTSLGQVRLLGEAHQCWADLHERMQARSSRSCALGCALGWTYYYGSIPTTTVLYLRTPGATTNLRRHSRAQSGSSLRLATPTSRSSPAWLGLGLGLGVGVGVGLGLGLAS